MNNEETFDFIFYIISFLVLIWDITKPKSFDLNRNIYRNVYVVSKTKKSFWVCPTFLAMMGGFIIDGSIFYLAWIIQFVIVVVIIKGKLLPDIGIKYEPDKNQFKHWVYSVFLSGFMAITISIIKLIFNISL